MKQTNSKKPTFISRYAYELVLLLFLIAWFIFMGIIRPSFLSLDNIVTVVTRVSETAIVAVGMTIVIITGGFDLSVGTIMAIVPAIIGLLFANGVNFFLAVIISLVIAAAVGIINGLLIAKARFQAIIGTLATMTALRSIIYVITDNKPVSSFPDGFENLAHATLIGIPIPIIILVVVVIVFHWMMRSTKFGRYIYATGGSPKSAKISGINVDRVIIISYVISALLAALGGIIFASRLISASPDAGTNTAFDVVTAVLLGGTSIVGGKGNIAGTIIGILILNFIINGLNLLGINSYWQMIFMGVVLLIAVGYDSRRRSGSVTRKLFREKRQNAKDSSANA